MDVALLSVLRDGLLRRSEASALRWGDVELQDDGSARIHVRRSKTDPEAEGAVLYIGPDAAAALVAILPEGFAVVDPSTTVFGLSESQIGRRVNAAAKAAGLGDGFTGHSGRGGGAARADDRRPVEEPENAGAVHRGPSCRPGGGGQVLPEERGLNSTISPSPGDKGRKLPAARTYITPGLKREWNRASAQQIWGEGQKG